jgi:hypothetical protein
MLLVKTSMWLILFTLMLGWFAIRTCFATVSFLFHSPVDTWTIIGRALSEAEKEFQ